ncbi:MAG: PTS sugar transporter subunit IIB [Oscillospiraceae bacterium]|nr:PTS sugar transporter subunit IIB [Oscillospiraceae bacterium]
MRVYTICVNGMGSSLILRMTVERALAQLGLDADVEAIDMGSYNGRKKPDLIVTTPSLARNIEPVEGMAIATITNFTDVNAAKENIRAAMNLE